MYDLHIYFILLGNAMQQIIRRYVNNVNVKWFVMDMWKPYKEIAETMIKVLKRNVYGFKNFKGFRIRILQSM